MNTQAEMHPLMEAWTRQVAELTRQNTELARQVTELAQQNTELAQQNIELAQQNTELAQQNAGLEHQIAELSAKLKWYEEQFRLAQQKRFGASSEKTPPEQLAFDLFNEAEVLATPQGEEPPMVHRPSRGAGSPMPTV